MLAIAALLASIAATYSTLYFWKRTRVLRARLDRLSATDDEVICVLEASDTPLAKRLLAVAQAPVVSAPTPTITPRLRPAPPESKAKTLSPELAEALLADVRAQDFDGGRFSVILDWAEGYRIYVGADAYSAIMREFDFDGGRQRARKVLTVAA